jgi:cyclophilin family peptidyl-prolyl cis-trans isomerase
MSSNSNQATKNPIDTDRLSRRKPKARPYHWTKGSFALFIFCLTVLAQPSTADSNFSHLSFDKIKALKQKVRQTPLPELKKQETYRFVTNHGSFTIKLFTQKAPKTCAHFKRLVQLGFYNKTLFHRIVPGYIIQGGDILSRDKKPNNDGTGDAGVHIKAEFSGLQHKKGTVSLARGPSPHSGSSQFFIMLSRQKSLDGRYTVFGQVVSGQKTLDKIAKQPVTYNRFNEKSLPINRVFLITIEPTKPPE